MTSGTVHGNVEKVALSESVAFSIKRYYKAGLLHSEMSSKGHSHKHDIHKQRQCGSSRDLTSC